MEEKTFKLRAHHGMCLHYFIGKGYSSSFVDNMWKQKEYLEQNDPLIEIIAKEDEICKECHHSLFGRCVSHKKVEKYDSLVLQYCQIENRVMHWKEFYDLVDEKILKTGKRKDICQDCSWNDICDKIETEIPLKTK